MRVSIQSIHFNADKKLLDFIQEKVSKLVHFYDHILSSEVFLKLDKSDNTENKIVQIKIEIPGGDVMAKEQCKTFEEATDLCVATLTRQIKRHKEKVRGM
ncbi:MAG: ribosome-associated translation inhibitor RaiA [Bacteroidetes bacterium]|nr:ribosome-associated translation inhibitor RaiA [Bacteroidota bacterium]